MYPDWIRSNHLKYFMKKGVLKYFAKFNLVYARVSFLSSGLRQLLLWLNTVSIQKQSVFSWCLCSVDISNLCVHKKIFCYICVYNLLFVVFSSQEILIFLILLVCTNKGIPKVIDPCDLLLHQVVLSFFYPVAVFCLILVRFKNVFVIEIC